jgi:hypothetical protein
VYPSTVYLHLYVSDPTQGGIELTSAGSYAPTSIANDSTHWPNAVGGMKSNGVALVLPTSSGPWSGPADYFWLANSATSLAVPGVPTITTAGTAGTTAYYYKITALSASGETTASGIGVITTGNATLSGSNYNIPAWSAVSGAATYNVYRSTDNIHFFLIANTASTSLHDTGLSAGVQTPPLSNTTLVLLDGGPLRNPIIVTAVGGALTIPPGALVIAAN